MNPVPVDPAELLDAKAAAAVLRQRESTLASWRCSGRGPKYFKIGRSVFYDPTDIATWLAAQHRDPRPRDDQRAAG